MDSKSTFTAVFVVAALLRLVQCECDSYPCLQYCSYRKHYCSTVANNSFVHRGQLRKENGVLKCVTNNPNTTNCSSSEWIIDSEDQNVTQFFPNGSFYTNQATNSCETNLHYTNQTTNSCETNLYFRNIRGIDVKGKIFRCDITKSDGDIEKHYVYIGKIDEGIFTSINMTIATNNFEDDGQKITLTCLSVGGPTTNVTWSRNNSKIVIDHEIYKTSQRILNTSHYPVYENSLTMKKNVGGKYRCEVSNYVSNYTIYNKFKSRKSISLVPSLKIKVSPEVLHTLYGVPFNLSCTAWTVALGITVPIDINIEWLKFTRKKLTTKWSGSSFVLNETTSNDGSFSVLTVNETDLDIDIVYRCNVKADNNSIQKHRDILIKVSDSSIPVIPFNVHVIDSDNDSVTIMWEVFIKTYPPVNYYVEYGPIDVDTDKLNRSKNNTVINDEVYSTVLTGLNSTVAYYYHVVAKNNLNKSTTSNWRSFTARKLLSIETSNNTKLGDSYTLKCIAVEFEFNPITSLTWRNNSDHATLNGTTFNSTTNDSVVLMHLQVNCVSVGSYTCSVTYSNGDSRQLTAVPNVMVAMSTSTNHILDVAPYNQFTCYCTASVSDSGLADTINQFTPYWQWKKEGLGSCTAITDFSFISSNKTTSMLLQTVNGNASNLTYQCVYSLGGANYTATNTVSVTSNRKPTMPLNVNVFEVSNDSVIINWTIPFIAYTPETYNIMLKYKDNNTVGLFGKTKSSGTDIEVEDQMYFVELKNLKPGTKYYYAVIAQNSVGNTTSDQASFDTQESVPGKVSYVIASRVNDTSFNISWGLADPPNGNITHYIIWINSTVDNHTRNVSASSQRRLIITGLNDTIYKVSVAAVNNRGIGPCKAVEIEIVFHQTEVCTNYSDCETMHPSQSQLCHDAPGNVSLLTASRRDDTTLSISWGLPDLQYNCNITDYIMWINSTSDSHKISVDALNSSLNKRPESIPSDHQINVFTNGAPRTVIVAGLSQTSLYTVYIAAAINDNVGDWIEWQEEMISVSTIGISTNDLCGPDMTWAVILLSGFILVIIITVVLVALFSYIKRRHSLSQRPIIGENFRFSALIDTIMKDDVKSLSWSPQPPNNTTTSVETEDVGGEPEESVDVGGEPEESVDVGEEPEESVDVGGEPEESLEEERVNEGDDGESDNDDGKTKDDEVKCIVDEASKKDNKDDEDCNST